MKSWEGIVVRWRRSVWGPPGLRPRILSSALFEPVLKGWAVLYPRFQLVPHVDPYQIVALFFLTVAPYTVIQSSRRGTRQRWTRIPS
jgi:hypothetical protein